MKKQSIEELPFDKELPLTPWQKKLYIKAAIKLGLTEEEAREIYDAPQRS